MTSGCGDDEQPERFDHNTLWYHMEDNETFLGMKKKEIYYSITAEMILAQPCPTPEQMTTPVP